MLKMTGIEVKLFSDTDMYLFIERGIRGAISFISKRYSKANNKHMKCCNSGKESNFIMYMIELNLYGWAMSQYLPYEVFNQLKQKEIDKFNINSIGEIFPVGYILKVDLDYPDDLHDLCNDCSLAPEKFKVNHDMLPNYCSNIANNFVIKIAGVNKSIPNLCNKNKYVLHYRNLQLHLSSGMELTKVHTVLKFKQFDWLKKHIGFNTDKTKNAAISSEKDFFTLMINSAFGKAIENLRRRINVRLVNNVEHYKEYVSKSNSISQKIFSENFIAIHETKQVFCCYS